MGDSILFGGHSTLLLELGGTRLLTDPLLGSPLFGLLRRHGGLDAAKLGRVDSVLVSHLHHDHLDVRSLRRVGAATPIIGPRGTRALLGRRGFPNVRELAVGETARVSEVTVRAVEAHHLGGRIFGLGPGETVGYVIGNGTRIYFAGDTELFPGMERIGEELDVAVLPIWGWGPRLGRGHLDPDAAAEAAAILRPRVVVPIHWGSLAPVGGTVLWPWLLERPVTAFATAMARAAPGVAVRALRPGETLDLAELPATRP